MAINEINIELYSHTPEIIGARIKSLRNLDARVKAWDDERYEARWQMCGVPDGASWYELADIADDDNTFYGIRRYFNKLALERSHKRALA